MYKIVQTFKNKKVVILGNTGFKGTWLSICMIKLGAKVYGISNGIPTKPSFFKESGVKKKLSFNLIDIKNEKKLSEILNSIKPDFIFHLAAQSLVLNSINDPKNTFETNIIGTFNVLNCIRKFNHKCTSIIITSDKCYLNKDKKVLYKESDSLGGKDPYSASKASAEIIFSCFTQTYLKDKKNIKIASARAGNVIGGGDWSPNRIIPDMIKAISDKKKFTVRNPNSTRPWQHVLEPIFGYILLAKRVHKENKRKSLNLNSFNFAPSKFKNVTVKKIIEIMQLNWPIINPVFTKNNQSSSLESKLLQLDSSKAKKLLGWESVLDLDETLDFTIEWYKNYFKSSNSDDIFNFSIKQIDKYLEIAGKSKQWKKILK